MKFTKIFLAIIIYIPTVVTQEIYAYKDINFANYSQTPYLIEITTKQKKVLLSKKINPNERFKWLVAGSFAESIVKKFFSEKTVYTEVPQENDREYTIHFTPFCFKKNGFLGTKTEITSGNNDRNPYYLLFNRIIREPNDSEMSYNPKADNDAWVHGFADGFSQGLFSIFSEPRPVAINKLADIACPCCCTQNERAYDFYAFEKGHKIGKTISCIAVFLGILKFM